jgi:cell division septal protein FtsQ
MKSIFKLLIVLVICLVAIGIYRGWFSYSSTSGDNQKDEINVSVDKGKIREDVQKAKTKVAEEVKEAVEKVKEKEGK